MARPTLIKSDEMPPTKGAAYPVFVPKTDADGRDIAGIHLPTLEAPIATHTGWNLRKAGFGEAELCDNNGSMIPFAATREERIKSGDPRLSMAERYPQRRRPCRRDREGGAATGAGPVAVAGRCEAVQYLKRLRQSWGEEMNPDRDHQEIKGWLRSSGLDDIADYATRGRKHRDLSPDDLSAAWVHAYERLATEFTNRDVLLVQNDLTAEYELRNEEPPYALVMDAMDRHAENIKAAISKLAPSDMEQFNENIFEKYSALKAKRES